MNKKDQNASSSLTYNICYIFLQKKYDTAIQRKIDIVAPDWITDSIRKASLQPIAEYKPVIKSQSPIAKTVQGNTSKQDTPNMALSTSSAFMTPVTPGQDLTAVSKETPTIDDERRKAFYAECKNFFLAFVVLDQIMRFIRQS